MVIPEISLILTDLFSMQQNHSRDRCIPLKKQNASF